MDLEILLKEYKALTLDIMEKSNMDGIIEYLVNERENILEQIKQISFSQQEIRNIADNLNVIQLDRELDLLIKKEKVNTRRKIENLKKMKNANMQYMSLSYASNFNKQI